MKTEEMHKRINTLTNLVELQKPIDEMVEALAELEWDYDGDPVVITAVQIAEVIKRYLANEIKADELERWANLVECREDIDFENSGNANLEQVIYLLANQDIEGEADADRCKHLIASIS